MAGDDLEEPARLFGIGVGSIRRLSAVRWGVAGRIVWAWILTIPASAFISAVTYKITAALIAP